MAREDVVQLAAVGALPAQRRHGRVSGADVVDVVAGHGHGHGHGQKSARARVCVCVLSWVPGWLKGWIFVDFVDFQNGGGGDFEIWLERR